MKLILATLALVSLVGCRTTNSQISESPSKAELVLSESKPYMATFSPEGRMIAALEILDFDNRKGEIGQVISG